MCKTFERHLSRLAQERLWLDGDLVGSWRMYKAAERLSQGDSLYEALRLPHLSQFERMALWDACLSTPRLEKTAAPWYRSPWLGALAGAGAGWWLDRKLFGDPWEDVDPGDKSGKRPKPGWWPRFVRPGLASLAGALMGYTGMDVFNTLWDATPSATDNNHQPSQDPLPNPYEQGC